MEREWFEFKFIESRIFERELKKFCASEEEQSKLKNFVAINRNKGDSIIGKSGIRKIRVPLKGAGKRGGGRVIYFFTDEDDSFIVFMLIYSKSEKEDLSHDEEVLLTKVLQQILRQRGKYE